MADAKHDSNWNPTLIGVSSTDGETPVRAEIDPGTGELLVKANVSVSGADGSILDGSNATIKATVKDLTNSNPLTTAIVDSNGDQISSFGGGTQYANGATAATPTGTVAMWRNSGDDSVNAVANNAPMPVSDTTSQGSLSNIDNSTASIAASVTGVSTETTLSAINAKLVSGTDIGDVTVNNAPGASAVNIQDGGNSITVDATSLPLPTGASTAAKQPALGTAGTASADVITVQGIASMTALKVDGSAVTQPVSDGGGSITVDGSVAADTELTTADLDLGAGTDTRAVVGIVGSKSGGAALIPGDATAGLKVDLGADNDVTVTSGTISTITNVVHVDDNASTLSVDDGAGSLTVDNAALSVTGGGVEASALRVTIASDSTGVLSVDDNGSSLTVDNGGTFAVQESGSALTALQLIDDPVFADDAAYTLSTSKGNVAAGVAVQTDGTDPTAVSAEGDAAALRTDMNRILLVNTTPPRLTSATENNATAQTNNPILSAPGAGLSLYITDIVISNGATAGSIKFVEDTGGTPVTKVQETYMAINGGAVMNFTTPIRITANKDFGYTSTTVTTHSITVNGYIAP